MRPETAISLALYALYHNRGSEEIGLRADVLDFLNNSMAKQEISIGGIRFRATPLGSHSDEVSEFIGRLALGGYLVQESPIRLTEDGVNLLRRHLVGRMTTDSDGEVAKAVDVLGLRGALEAPVDASVQAYQSFCASTNPVEPDSATR